LQPCHVPPTHARRPSLSPHDAAKASRPHRARRPCPQVSEEERIREVRAEATRRIKALGAQRKLKEAIQELAGLSRLGVQPDTQAGTALVAACAQSGNMEMAESVFEQLFGEGAAGVHARGC
jgi:pentatricopeptide repeat protein